MIMNSVCAPHGDLHGGLLSVFYYSFFLSHSLRSTKIGQLKRDDLVNYVLFNLSFGLAGLWATDSSVAAV